MVNKDCQLFLLKDLSLPVQAAHPKHVIKYYELSLRMYCTSNRTSRWFNFHSPGSTTNELESNL